MTIISQDNSSFEAAVESGSMYPPSLADPLNESTLERVLPGVETIEEGRKVCLQWWKKEEIAQMGVMGIHLRLL